MNLNITISDRDLQICANKICTHFEVTHITVEYLSKSNITVLTNQDKTYFTILNKHEDHVNCDYTLLDENLRGQGLGLKYLLERTKYCLLNFPNYFITSKVRTDNLKNINTLIRGGYVSILTGYYWDNSQYYLMIYKMKNNGK